MRTAVPGVAPHQAMYPGALVEANRTRLSAPSEGQTKLTATPTRIVQFARAAALVATAIARAALWVVYPGGAVKLLVSRKTGEEAYRAGVGHGRADGP